jgi:chromosome segregation ATPase
MQMVEEVKLKKNLITELKKENMEYEAKMKQQQNLYEAVRAERNLYSKNCIEAQDEVIELKRKFKIASHNISNLKDEIDRKNQALTNEHHTLGMIQREKQKLTRILQERDALINKLDSELNVKHTEHEMQAKIIKNVSKDYEELKKLLADKVNERDILGTQLIRRNDELALLYEKIKILQSTLSKGEI